MTSTIHIAAALLIGPCGRTLLVRKRGTLAFMQPGGKIEPGEAPVAALARELEEELGVVIEPAAARFIGSFSAPAANEPGFEVKCELFEVVTDASLQVAAEIEEAVWVDERNYAELQLAPLTLEQVMPIYLARG